MIGSMGMASAIGLGVALAAPARPAVVFDGDGNLLMSLGILPMIGGGPVMGRARPANLTHVVFDNALYGSTGSQASPSRAVGLHHLARAAGYERVTAVAAADELHAAVATAVAGGGPSFILAARDRRGAAGAPHPVLPGRDPRSLPRQPRRARDPMKAVILAAGVARRLAPLTDTTHKALLAVGGRSLLDRMLDALAACGVEESVLVVGHCQDQVRRGRGRRARRDADPLRREPGLPEGLDPLALVRPRDACGARPHPDHGRRRALPRPLPDPAHRRARAERAAARPRLPGHRRGGQALRGGRSGHRARQEVRAREVGRDRRGSRLLQVRRGPRPGVRPPPGGVHRGDGRGRTSTRTPCTELLARVPVGWVDVTGLPWTEVDFAEDLRRAETEILPGIERLGR